MNQPKSLYEITGNINDINTVLISRHEYRTIQSQQAIIDALMLEYCPNEMTKEQMDNWKKHQVPYVARAEELLKIFPDGSFCIIL